MQLSHVQSGWKLKNRSFLCHPMSEVGAVFMQTSRAKNHPDISFCMPTMWPTLPPPTSAMYARHHLSTGHPPPYTLLHSTQTPSTTRDQASVRDGLAIDTKCGTKCRKGAPQTHTQCQAHRRLRLLAKPRLWLTPGMPRRSRGSCSQEGNGGEKRPSVKTAKKNTCSHLFELTQHVTNICKHTTSATR